MSLNRKFIASQVSETGIDDTGITAIMNAHNATVQSLKDELEKAKSDTAKALAEAKELESTIAEMQDDSETEKELETVKAKLEQVEKDHAEALKKANDEHEQTKTAYATEKSNAEIDEAVAKGLEAVGFGESSEARDALKTFMRSDRYDRNEVKRDENGKFTNIDEYVRVTVDNTPSLKTYVGEMAKTGADVGTPPTGASNEGEQKFEFGFTPIRQQED